MPRLFPPFARGSPAAGLLLLRIVIGTHLLFAGVVALSRGGGMALELVPVLSGILGILLLAGLCTPVAGVLVAIHALLDGFAHPYDRWQALSLGGIGVALTLLGPGVWSIDARLFGWKRIDLPRNIPPE